MRSLLARLLLVPLLLLAGCRTPAATEAAPLPVRRAEPPAPQGPIRLTLVATNDLHGWVHPHGATLPDGQVVEEGGLSTLAGYLAILRAENPGGVLLLDGGDLFQGTLASNLTEGQVVISAFNHLGYAAAALGNHEFDYGPVGPVSAATEPGQDPFGALKVRLSEARFPLLAANIYDARTGARPDWLPDDGTALVEARGVKVGIVGLITPSTPSVTNPVNVTSLRFGSLVPVTVDAAARLRQRGAEVVVVVAHAGGKCGAWEDPDDLSSCDLRNGEIFELLAELPEGTVDAVVAGHTHSELAHRVRGVPVVETRGLGKSFAVLDLFVDPQTRRVMADRAVIGRNVAVCQKVDAALGSCDPKLLKAQSSVKLVPASFRGQPVVRDAQLDALLAPVMARVDAEQRRKVNLQAPKSMGRNYEAESALGVFLADSLREMEQADVALLNPGGLRADLPAGELRYGDIYEIIPFDNTVAVITVTGDELRRLLQAAYGAHKGVFQISGMKVTLGRCPGKGRLKSVTLPDGKPLQPDRRYRVAVPDFLARGGDGLGPVLASLPPGRIDLGIARPLNFRDGLVDFWQRRGEPLVAPALGRIAFSDSGSGCNSGEIAGDH
jgi:5'-nucleotidase